MATDETEEQNGFEVLVSALEQRGLVAPTWGAGVMAHCPGPLHSAGDVHSSLHVNEGDDGSPLFYCFVGCEPHDILFALDLTWKDVLPDGRDAYHQDDVVASYVYTSADGEPLFRKQRTLPKGFYWQYLEGDHWVMGQGDERVLYAAPEIRRAVEDGTPIYILEGEKDVDTFAATQTGAVATTAGGATSWRDEHVDALRGATTVIIVPDNDPTGRKRAELVRRALAPVVTELFLSYPAHGKDFTDHVMGGGDRHDLLAFEPDADIIFEPIDWESYSAPRDEWLFKPWVPAGARVLVHGESGALKSLWAMWLADKLAREGKRVAYFSTEMNRGALVKRMRSLRPPKNLKLYGAFTLGRDLDTAIKSFEGYDLLVVDSWSSSRGDVSSNDNDGIAMLDKDFFLPLITATGATLMLIDNTGKAKIADDGTTVKQDTARGASAKRDKMEVELWFTRPDRVNNYRTKMACTKMRLDERMPKDVVIETPQDRIEFYYVSQGMVSGEPLWPGLIVGGASEEESLVDDGDGAMALAPGLKVVPSEPAPPNNVVSDRGYPAEGDTESAEGAGGQGLGGPAVATDADEPNPPSVTLGDMTGDERKAYLNALQVLNG